MANILIVDDDAAIRTMFARVVRQLGAVDQAAHGAEALRMLAAKPYDVVLLDLHMPAIDGLMVLELLASKKGPNSETPVVLITADTSEQARAKAFHRGAVFALTKPVAIHQLLTLVTATLAGPESALPTPDKEPAR